MDEAEREQALLTALSDQSRAMLHEQWADIERIAGQHPSLWSERDHLIAWAVLNAVMGLLCEGKI